MKVLRSMSRVLLASVCLAASQFVAAGVISFEPTPALGDVGDTIFVDLVWDGSQAGPGYLGDWDVEVMYDESIVAYQGAAFGFGVDSLGCLVCGDNSVPGVVSLFEVSFDSVNDLIANQNALGNTFTIATLEFLALADGVTDLVFGDTVFGDENGSLFGGAINPLLVDGQICIGPDGCEVATIPTPAILPMLLASLIFMFRQRTGT